MRRMAQGVAECDIEMEFAVSQHGREFAIFQWLREPGFDVFQNPPSLPGSQPRTGSPGARYFRLSRRRQEFLCTTQMQHGMDAVIAKRLIQRPRDVRDG